MTFKVTIEKQTDGSYIAYNNEDEGAVIIGTGATVNEAKDDFFRSMEETAEACREAGISGPEMLDGEPQFSFDLSSLLEYYDVLNASALARRLGINESLMRQYKAGGTYISDSQLKRIEDGIHSLGNELARLKLV